MKVQDVMQPPFMVSPDTPLHEVRRLIFSLGITGVPVVDDKKVIGYITENNIMEYTYSTVQQSLQQYDKNGDTKQIEDSTLSLLATQAKKIMTKAPIHASTNESLLNVQERMKQHRINRMIVVDKNGELVGTISYGDIIRSLMSSQAPSINIKRYAKFAAEYYDQVTNWEVRFELELPSLLRLLRKHNVKRVIELGSWTGEYALELVREGMERVVALDNNPLMIDISHEKQKMLPSNKRKKVNFHFSEFNNVTKIVQEKFDAALAMGNALSYIREPIDSLFKQILTLLEDDGIFVAQVINYQKVISRKSRLLSFKIQKGKEKDVREHLFLEFFDKLEGNWIAHNIITFDSDGKRWTYKGFNTIPIQYLTQDGISKTLKTVGFKNISFSGNMGQYQGDYGQISFTKPFEPTESDWLNVVAKR